VGATCNLNDHGGSNLNDHGGPSFWHPSAQEPPVIAIDSGKEFWSSLCSFKWL